MSCRTAMRSAMSSARTPSRTCQACGEFKPHACPAVLPADEHYPDALPDFTWYRELDQEDFL